MLRKSHPERNAVRVVKHSNHNKAHMADSASYIEDGIEDSIKDKPKTTVLKEEAHRDALLWSLKNPIPPSRDRTRMPEYKFLDRRKTAARDSKTKGTHFSEPDTEEPF